MASEAEDEAETERGRVDSGKVVFMVSSVVYMIDVLLRRSIGLLCSMVRLLAAGDGGVEWEDWKKDDGPRGRPSGFSPGVLTAD